MKPAAGFALVPLLSSLIVAAAAVAAETGNPRLPRAEGSSGGMSNMVRLPLTDFTAILQGNQASAQFGSSVALAGDVNGDGYADVIVGAPLYDSGQTNEGAVFVFLGSATGIVSGGPAAAHAILQGNQASAQFGSSVAGAGDVNGDGYADVVVGAGFYDSGETDEGAAFVFLGSATGIASGGPAGAAATLQANQANAWLGLSVAAAGDVNGDGYADVVVGATLYDAGQTDEGAAFVFLGSASGIASGGPTNAAATLEGNQGAGAFGHSVAGAGDVNWDGYADVLVGAYTYDLGETNEGAAFVFLGSASGIASGGPASAATTLQSNDAGTQFGFSVAGAGDFTEDGYADVLIGGNTAGQDGGGAAYLFPGSASGVASGGTLGAAILTSGQPGASLGASVAGAGDVNGDGRADVLVGAHAADLGQTDEGAAFVLMGTLAEERVTLEADQASALFGLSVAGAGDVNGNGSPDFLVGAPLMDSGQTDEGTAFVYLGSAPCGTLANATPIFIPAVGSSGVANPYPSNIPVANLAGSVKKVTVRLISLDHTYPEDVDILLVGPGGQNAIIMSDVGGGVDAASVTLTLDDGALLGLPVNAALTSGTFRPTNFDADDTFPAPAPTPLGGSALSVFNGTNPNGTWSLMVVDDEDFDVGNLSGGWELTIATESCRPGFDFHTLTPCRVADTRSGSGAPIGTPTLTSGIQRTLTMVNRCGIPTTARAVSVNLTTVGPTGTGFLAFYPNAGAPTPTSNLNFTGDRTRANNGVLGLNALGQVHVLAIVNNPAGADQVDLILDVNGYFE